MESRIKRARGKMKKICVITGSRAEYGLLRLVIKVIKKHPKLDLSILVAGMHLAKKFGDTINEIEKDNFNITGKVYMNPGGDIGDDMSYAIGKGIKGFTDRFREIKPDIILILGDRIEVLAAAIAAAYMNIAIAHIHGGDITKAGLDESCRYAISSFAHIHFAATKKSAQRLLKIGEEPRRIFITGAPGLEAITNEKLIDGKGLEKELGINLKKPTILVLQHSVTTQVNKVAQQIKETINAIKDLKFQTIFIYPNSDAGGRMIIQEIEKLRELNFVHIFKNLSNKKYFSLLKNIDVLVGNSSSGIIEAPTFKLPVVNIGMRQFNRERACNIIDVDHKKSEIVKAIKLALSKQMRFRMKRCISPYKKRKTSSQIARILSEIKIDNDFLQKKKCY